MPFEPDAPSGKFVPDKPLVEQIPGGEESDAPQAPKATESIWERLKGAAMSRIGVGEAALSAATGAVAAPVGAAAGLVRAATNGKFGTQEGAADARGAAGAVSDALTYAPRTDKGKEYVGDLGKAVETSKLAGLNPMEGLALGRTTAPAMEAAGTAGRAGVQKLTQATADRAMPMGNTVGAMATPAETLRRERAASLPVPVELMKGQASRDFEQLRFERETAKDGRLGMPLRERYAEQNQAILGNFDAWVDQTGAQAGDLRAVGKAVSGAVALKAQRAKGEINAAYAAAEKAGDMAERVATSPIQAYLEQHRPEAVNAGILTSAEQKLKLLTDKDGAITINDLEELRKMVGNLSGKDATNAHFGKELKEVIDGLTEGKGGEAYKKARALRRQYAQEFENVRVIDRLLSTKPGTSDRAVAFEDVFKHSILNGSLDDVRAMRKTLQTAGPEGEQAWKELQGQTVNYLKEVATSNVATDVRGNRIVSAAKLDRAVRDLDRDGKLDFVFGKKGAQQMREITELVGEIYTVPPGAVNTSGTASVLLEALSNAALGKLPTAAGKAIGLLKEEIANRQTKRQVRDALEQPLPPQSPPPQQPRSLVGLPWLPPS